MIKQRLRCFCKWPTSSDDDGHHPPWTSTIMNATALIKRTRSEQLHFDNSFALTNAFIDASTYCITLASTFAIRRHVQHCRQKTCLAWFKMIEPAHATSNNITAKPKRQTQLQLQDSYNHYPSHRYNTTAAKTLLQSLSLLVKSFVDAPLNASRCRCWPMKSNRHSQILRILINPPAGSLCNNFVP